MRSGSVSNIEARQRRRSRFMRWTFIAAVASPTVIAALYYGVWAAPRYVSETQFIVRTVQGNQPGGASVLQSLFQAMGMSRSTDDSNAVLSYLQSRDAVAGLAAALPLRQIYARQEADALARFPRPFMGDSFEHLYWYYGDRVTVWSDEESGIITLQAQAFRPDDAQAIARQLVSQAEGLVNEMNARLEADTDPNRRGRRGRGSESRPRRPGGHRSVSQRGGRRRSDAERRRPARHDHASCRPRSIRSWRKFWPTSSFRLQIRRPSLLRRRPTRWRRRSSPNRKGLPDRKAPISSKVTTYERLTLLRSLADASLGGGAIGPGQRAHGRPSSACICGRGRLPEFAGLFHGASALRSVAMVFAISLAVAGGSLAPVDRRQGAPELSETGLSDNRSREFDVRNPGRFAVAVQPGPVLEQSAANRSAGSRRLRSINNTAPPPRGLWRRHGLFIATVIAPMAIVAGFLLLVAAPRYSSTRQLHRPVDRSDRGPGSAFLPEEGPRFDHSHRRHICDDAYLSSRDMRRPARLATTTSAPG